MGKPEAEAKRLKGVGVGQPTDEGFSVIVMAIRWERWPLDRVLLAPAHTANPVESRGSLTALQVYKTTIEYISEYIIEA